MRTVLLDGSTWPLLPIDNTNRLLNIDDTVVFRYHKGADQQPNCF
jgi:hypothetical protein